MAWRDGRIGVIMFSQHIVDLNVVIDAALDDYYQEYN